MPELLEREDNLRELAAALAQACAGAGRVVLIAGEAGIGKTALVERLAADSRGPVRRLWVACDALFTPRPLGPLQDMAAQLGGEWPARVAARAAGQELFTAFQVELQSRPTLAVIEDVHWADEATLDLLKFLGRRVQRLPALLVITYRDDELSARHPLRLLLGDLASATRLTLAPLSSAGVRALAGDRPVDADALHRRTGGNPFFVTEVLATGSAQVPATVRDAVLARAARLSASGRAVLEAAAVLGPRIEPRLLAELAGAEGAAIDEGLASGVLVAQSELITFRHELARQIILDAISPAHRLVLHRLALDALRASPTAQADLARLAHHAEAAHDREAVLAYAPAAARQAAAAHAYRAADALYALALRYADDLPLTERAQLLDEYSVECDRADRRPEAITTRRQAAGLWQRAGQPLRHGESLSRLAQLHQIVGERAEAESANAAALAVLEPLTPNLELITAYNTQAWLHLGNNDNRQGVAAAEQAIALAQQLGAADELPRLYEIAGLCWLYLDQARGTRSLEQSLALSLQFDHATRAGNTYANLASIYVDFHDFQRAAELFATGLPYASERELESVRAYMLGWQAILEMHLGHWDAAAGIVAESLQRPATSPGRGPALIALGRLRARRGDPDPLPVLEESLALLLRQGFRQREGMLRAALAEAAWLAGDLQRTREEARAAFDLAQQHRQAWYVGELAFWLWRAGDRVDVPAWAARPYALHLAGDWRGAAAAWETLGCLYEQARALADGDYAAQVTALSIFERLGARPAADAVRRGLQAAGQAVPRGPRAATRANPFGLTARQQEVLTLLADGLSNGEIAARLHLSAKTAEHHVSAILAKLDVTTRAEAAERARRGR